MHQTRSVNFSFRHNDLSEDFKNQQDAFSANHNISYGYGRDDNQSEGL